MEDKTKRKIKNIIMALVLISVLIGMFTPFKDKIIEARGLKENHCIEEEIYYYRIEGGFLFSQRVRTTEENADSFDYDCVKWEEELVAGKAFFGQKLVHNKGGLNP